MYNIIHIFISLSICTTLLVPEVEAFTPCSRPALYYPQTEKVVTSTRSRLYAVADPPSPPADYQGEDEKQRASDGDADDWTPTEGGFGNVSGGETGGRSDALAPRRPYAICLAAWRRGTRVGDT